MKKTTEEEYKVCPLLEKLGIGDSDSEKGIGICQVCPLKMCIEDYKGAIKKTHLKLLLREAKKWEKREQ